MLWIINDVPVTPWKDSNVSNALAWSTIGLGVDVMGWCGVGSGDVCDADGTMVWCDVGVMNCDGLACGCSGGIWAGGPVLVDGGWLLCGGGVGGRCTG